MGRGRKKTRVERCWTLSTSELRTVFKPTTGFCSGRLEWRNAEGEATCSIGFEFSQQPSPTFTIFYSAIRQEPKEQQDLRYPIELVTAPCRFGGRRYWFICPAVKNGVPCRRKVMKLYLPPGQTIYFACRHCYELTYRSCQEHDGRLARLCKNPLLLQQMLESKKWSDQFRALKAAIKLHGI